MNRKRNIFIVIILVILFATASLIVGFVGNSNRKGEISGLPLPVIHSDARCNVTFGLQDAECGGGFSGAAFNRIDSCNEFSELDFLCSPPPFKNLSECLQTCLAVDLTQYEDLGGGFYGSESQVIYRSGKKIKDGPPLDFKVLSDGWAKDREFVYHRNERINYVSDVKSFEIITGGVHDVGFDNLNLYYRNSGAKIVKIPLQGEKPKMLDRDYDWIAIGDKAYFNGELIKGVDGRTLSVLSDNCSSMEYMKDISKLILRSEYRIVYLDDVDFDTLEIIRCSFARDKKSFIYDGQRVSDGEYNILVSGDYSISKEREVLINKYNILYGGNKNIDKVYILR